MTVLQSSLDAQISQVQGLIETMRVFMKGLHELDLMDVQQPGMMAEHILRALEHRMVALRQLRQSPALWDEVQGRMQNAAVTPGEPTSMSVMKVAASLRGLTPPVIAYRSGELMRCGRLTQKGTECRNKAAAGWPACAAHLTEEESRDRERFWAFVTTGNVNTHANLHLLSDES